MSEFQFIGKPHPGIDAVNKVRGQYNYMSDLRLPGMLWGKVLRSTRAHALIKRIDCSKAEQLPGVKAVITAADAPGIPCGPFLPDWRILAGGKVTFIGEEVAAVAAESPEIAEKALGLITVEYEDLPAVFDPVVAMESGSPLVREGSKDNIAFTFDVSQGDVEDAFAGSDYVREEIFYTSSAFHAYLEPNGSIASYDRANGSFTLWAASQVPYKARLLYSKAMGVDLDKLRLIQVPFGGGFGGKFESNYHLVAMCLSKKAGKPVRLVNSMAEEFLTATLRVPMKIVLKVGITKEGKITARESLIIADNGARTNYGPATLSTACFRVDSLYKIDNVRAKGYLVYTNNVSKGAMRGFGNPQMLFAMESILDMLAEDAGLDPLEIRLKNCFKAGEVSVHGWEIGSCGLPECLEKAARQAGWEQRKSKEKKGTKLRGLGLGCCNHVSGYRPILPDFDGSAAHVKVGPDGKVLVFTGEVDMGQGYQTIAAQIAAEEVGVPIEWVNIAEVDSETSVLGIGCLASRGTVMGGNAVIEAARDVRKKILAGAAKLLNRNSDQLTIKNGRFYDNVTNEDLGSFRMIIRQLTNLQAGQPFMGSGHYYPDTVMPDAKTKYGNPSPAYSFAAHIAEVEVDTETGQVEVIKYIAANDVGQVMNPLMAKGQLEGGALQGIGWALSENLIVIDGEIVNNNFLDYKIPTTGDMTKVVPVLVEAGDPKGPYGAKSLGEPAFNPVAAAVCNAIYDAVGVRITSLPVTADKLLEALKTGSEQGGEAR